jgi:predicted short-subunit dehydrogenase-like oxidoreductase (DUF2520 family)
MRIGFIGAGKVGRTLAQRFIHHGYDVVIIADREVPAQQVVDMCDLIFITTQERNVSVVVDSVTWPANKSVVHCSSVVPLSVFDKPREAGCNVGVFYPIHNFSNQLDMAGATVVINAQPPLYHVLKALATGIGCRSVQTDQMAAIHASIPYTQEFLVALLMQGTKLWSSVGISEESAMPALVHLMKSAIMDVAQTGSIILDDPDTVGKHIDTITQVDPEAAELYKQLTLRTMPFEMHHFEPQDELRMRVWLKSGKLLGK